MTQKARNYFSLDYLLPARQIIIVVNMASARRKRIEKTTSPCKLCRAKPKRKSRAPSGRIGYISWGGQRVNKLLPAGKQSFKDGRAGLLNDSPHKQFEISRPSCKCINKRRDCP